MVEGRAFRERIGLCESIKYKADLTVDAARKRLKDIRLEIDGGVKVDNIAEISAAGIDTFVAGSAIFGSEDYEDTISKMKQNAS